MNFLADEKVSASIILMRFVSEKSSVKVRFMRAHLKTYCSTLLCGAVHENPRVSIDEVLIAIESRFKAAGVLL
ncbi:hypothetical protein HUU40_19755 [candidate division KSB1 bacterium]|nr:hypothetical protein [candidate division KSB1 bacterium]